MLEESQKAINFRNFIFGVEDSLVSTVGLLSGIASADVPGATIFLTGVVLILVEAISMAAGSFLAETSTEDFVEKREVPARKSVVGSFIMFFSYLLAGLIPLLPYSLTAVGSAFKISIALSLISLFLLGLIGSKIAKISLFKGAARMVLIGGGAILVGVLAGHFMAGLQV